MSEKETSEEDIVCSFCGKKTSEVKVMVAKDDGHDAAICGKCLKLCEAVIEEGGMEDSGYHRIPSKKYNLSPGKLRPITRIPEGWHICDTELYARTPYVTACSRNGKRHAEFAVPKPLAWWMISNDEKLDVDKLREDITKHISYVIWQTLMKY